MHPRGGLFLSLGILGLYVILAVLVLLNPSASFPRLLIRLAAVMGIYSLFIASIMSSSPKTMKDIFGRSFLFVHHVFSFVGLFLITLHPVTLALSIGNWMVFLPVFDSLETFLISGGRPALLLIYTAVFAAFFRTRLRYWRNLHWLNYAALFLGVVHGILIGTDFKSLIFPLIFVSFLVLTLLVFLRKRKLLMWGAPVQTR